MQAHATNIVRELRSRGFQAYFAGGCVRDTLLGVAPADYDVATDATPAEVMRIFPETYAVGAQFGVVLVPLKTPSQAQEDWVGTQTSLRQRRPSEHPNYVEVATFRNDGTYTDGRHPDRVSYSKDPQEDVQRRDFTINGLLMDPLDSDRVLDFVGGRDDLKAGIIRAIGDAERRFAEDKLRMLRAVRFAARFGYSIEPATFAAIQRLAPGIQQVSRERVRDELTKMLTEGHARRAFELLDSTGLLREVLPEVDRMKGVEQPPEFHPEGDVWVHTLLLLEKLPPRMFSRAGLGQRCCTMSASRRPFALRPTASASTATSRSACAWPRKFATASTSPTKTPARSLRWWPTTCALPTPSA